MIAFRPRLRALLVGVGVVALVTIGAGGTLAASTPTIYACYNVYGQVAMSSTNQCKLAGGGQLVQINAQGIQGPTGPQGPTGARGPIGPTGPTAPMFRYSGHLDAGQQGGIFKDGGPSLIIDCGNLIDLSSSDPGGEAHIWTATTSDMALLPDVATLNAPISSIPGVPQITAFTAVAGGGALPLYEFHGLLSTGTEAEGCSYDITSPI
jgi:hypothetical protein